MPQGMMFRTAELLVWMQDHVLVAGAIAVILLIPGAVCCWAARRGATISRQALTQIDQRLTHIRSAVELLTDTTESGLQSAFGEIERLSQYAAEPTRVGLPARVVHAARDGRTAREIAQAEGVSEGEVRLRLRLSGSMPN